MDPYRLNQVTVGNVLKATWEFFKNNFLTLLLIGLLALGSQYLNTLTGISLNPLKLIFYILITLILVPIINAMYELEIYDADLNDRSASISSMVSNFNTDLARLAVKRNFIIFLWFFALIIPGIYYTYAYSRVLYVKHDHPELSDKECFNVSKRQMDNYKLTLFTSNLAVGIITVLIMAPFIYSILNSAVAQQMVRDLLETKSAGPNIYGTAVLTTREYTHIVLTAYPFLGIILGLISVTINAYASAINPIFQSLRTKEYKASNEL